MLFSKIFPATKCNTDIAMIVKVTAPCTIKTRQVLLSYLLKMRGLRIIMLLFLLALIILYLTRIVLLDTLPEIFV